MKTQKINIKIISIIAAALSAGVLSVSAGANSGEQGIYLSQAEGSRTGVTGSDDPALIYNSQSYGPAIQSYPSNTGERESASPEIVYVSLAYGPAIYSYPYGGSEKTVPWNVEYVDQGYGPAIYSYPYPKAHNGGGMLKLISALFE